MNFAENSLYTNLVLFLLSAGFVWFAGTKLSQYLDAISEKSGLASGFVGMLILGGITSLPELATVSTATLGGNGVLAVNNMVGSIAINLVLLAVVDIRIGKDALTSFVAHASTLLQATLGVIMLTVMACAVVIGGGQVAHISLWSLCIALLFVLLMWMAMKYRGQDAWVIQGGPRTTIGEGEGALEKSEQLQEQEQTMQHSLRDLTLRTLGAAVVILVAGFVLTKTAEGLAQQTGLGSGFMGLTLLGLATGLPELSSIIGAARMGNYEMAMGNIFGTNIWNVLFIAIADALYFSGPIVESIGNFELVAILLSILLTLIYIVGLLEKRDKTILRMGVDSLAVLVIYCGGLLILYSIGVGPP